MIVPKTNLHVTKTYLPPLDEYLSYVREIWEEGWVTNNGRLVQQLENHLKQFLGVSYLQYVNNGTVALQLALNALKLKGKILTTPYSYVATSSVIHWENCQPVFVDIHPETLCIDPNLIEEHIDEQTTAILATHVYGYPCDVAAIDRIAKKHNLKVIYDGAHAFGVKINGTPIYQYGDISTISFHATKVFHTVEGGAVITNEPEVDERVFLSKAFGHRGDEHYRIGINGKNSEFHAAMGLCNLPRIGEAILQRKQLSELYQEQLKELPIRTLQPSDSLSYNYAYFPIILEDYNTMQRIKQGLEEQGIFPRRYFYPALNQLPYHQGSPCPVAEDIVQRVLCLPLHNTLKEDEAVLVASVIKQLF
ncbi:DegT/DnrJ/EryC1/StrS family aminotransferase [Tunicatimonas pelagia]|uniref:DegT/DnrJ/EryC1/StrS family aminotransferase n=1 Tax=Tunicatimonas pelagia TaxID=931531 RepID=UPI002665EC83|nr:DegT/DnrJ/EryC1/StrS family aminotransferase [Tunicatimonas pelagia]WKN45142.1 DegT/DnrJ/EryC1/StrS family aminotransferase [Tunicatimonas pelagia]